MNGKTIYLNSVAYFEYINFSCFMLEYIEILSYFELSTITINKIILFTDTSEILIVILYLH